MQLLRLLRIELLPALRALEGAPCLDAHVGHRAVARLRRRADLHVGHGCNVGGSLDAG